MKSIKPCRWLAFAAVIAAAVCLHSPAFAQAKAPAAADTAQYKVLIGTGQADGTYDVMSKQLLNMCRKGNVFGLTNTTGTVANIDGILANQLDAGFGQEDSLFLKKSTNPEVKGLKTLLTMAPEEIHVFVRKNTGLFMEKSVVGVKYKGDPIVFTFVEQLAGYHVAAWGGSFDTARLIAANGGINYTTVKVANLSEALKKLDTGEVQGVLAVAGAPAKIFEDIAAGPYKLIGFKDATVLKLVSIYNGGAVLNYSNLDAEGINTVSTNAIVFTREYTDAEMIHELAAFRECAYAAVPKLKDMRGMHKKWRAVSVTNKGKWEWYNLPTAAAAAAPAPTPKRK